MADLTTNYMGLKLKNPVIAASSGLTNSTVHIKQLAEAGIGAVVLKSLFEEQINMEVNNLMDSNQLNYDFPGAEDMIMNYTKSNNLGQYLKLITNAKAAVDIPVIASINCIRNSDWTSFAKDIQNAGADALELNIFEFPSSKNDISGNYEQKYIEILSAVKKIVTIPVSVKISHYFSNLVRIVDLLYANGADAVTIFNRFWEPDINLETLEITSSKVMSSPSDYAKTLRWTGILAGVYPKKQIAATTGIHDGNTVIKMLLAGAQVTQLCSTLYINGFGVLDKIFEDIEIFMKRWNFKEIDDFRGKLSYADIPSFELYERAQFLKYYTNKSI